MKKIVIVAGDKSGDLYGGLLSKKLKEKFPSINIYSFGGESLAQHSHQIIDLLSHSVSGIFEVLSSLKRFVDIFRLAYQEINKIKPDLIILIDFPDFNLRLARKINKKYSLFYYISPQVWAWRKKRVEIIKKYIEKMVVIFKFEEDFYKKEGIDVLYFGHPLLEIIKEDNVEIKKVVSFLPGSRKNEIKRHLPIMAEVKDILKKDLKDYLFRIIKAPNIEKDFYERVSPKILLENHSYRAIQESEFIITSSGTATVEIAILGVPYLIIYKVNPLSWQILKRMVNTKYVGMVNILSSRNIIEELLQEEANPKRIADATLHYLRDKKAYEEIKNSLKEIKNTLSPFGATDKFADFIGAYLNINK